MMSKKLFIFSFLIISIVGVPVPKNKKTESGEQAAKSDLKNTFDHLHYNKYLQEVISVLEKDEEFIKRISNFTKPEDMAQQLDMVHHSVRSKLDEIKRQEVERLNALEKMLELQKQGKGDAIREGKIPIHPDVINMDQETIKKAHVDHVNPYTFEIQDLEKLIKQITSDMSELDKTKEEQYKQYEMAKEHVRRKKLKKIHDPKVREAEDKKFEEAKKDHKKHEKLHHPGSKEQLQDVWENDDHMDKNTFNPRTFFQLHDINGDGHLDMAEIESLFHKELSKVYNKTGDNTVDDVEMNHEMERMRQEVLKNVDKNGDHMVSWDEFKDWTKSQDYKKDDEWKTAEEDDKAPYDDDEFKKFEDDYDKEHPDDDDDEHHDKPQDHPDQQHKQPESHQEATGEHHQAQQQHPGDVKRQPEGHQPPPGQQQQQQAAAPQHHP